MCCCSEILLLHRCGSCRLRSPGNTSKLAESSICRHVRMETSEFSFHCHPTYLTWPFLLIIPSYLFIWPVLFILPRTVIRITIIPVFYTALRHLLVNLCVHSGFCCLVSKPHLRKDGSSRNVNIYFEFFWFLGCRSSGFSREQKKKLFRIRTFRILICVTDNLWEIFCGQLQKLSVFTIHSSNVFR
jgi:hypothetical protein